jgi:hypothetical protein
MTGPDDLRPPSGRLAPRTVAALVMVAIFAAGAAAGVAFDHGVLHGGRPASGGRPEFVPGAAMPHPGSPPGARAPGRPPSFERFVRDLDLTPAQAAVVDSAMARDFAAIRAARETMQPRVDSIVAATRAVIDSVLTEPQRAKYRALLAAQARRVQEMGRDRRRRPGGPT